MTSAAGTSRSGDRTVTLRVYRFNPQVDPTPRYLQYQVPWTPGLSVLEALRHVCGSQDSTLAFYDYSCGRGVCQGCLLEINGRTQRSCHYLLDEDNVYTIGPAQGYPVVRDLRIDFGFPIRWGSSREPRWMRDGAGFWDGAALPSEKPE